MQGWCMLGIGACVTGILLGTCWLHRSRGVRIVRGRSRAAATYAELLAAVAMVGLIGALFVRIHPIVAANPQVSSAMLPILLASPPLLIAGVIWMWLGARQLARSVLFYNVRRDQLAVAVEAALRQAHIPVVHRLRTFKDEFAMPGGRLILHGDFFMSRIEWLGPLGTSGDSVIQAAIEHLRSELQARGRDVIDERAECAATA